MHSVSRREIKSSKQNRSASDVASPGEFAALAVAQHEHVVGHPGFCKREHLHAGEVSDCLVSRVDDHEK